MIINKFFRDTFRSVIKDATEKSTHRWVVPKWKDGKQTGVELQFCDKTGYQFAYAYISNWRWFFRDDRGTELNGLLENYQAYTIEHPHMGEIYINGDEVSLGDGFYKKVPSFGEEIY